MTKQQIPILKGHVYKSFQSANMSDFYCLVLNIRADYEYIVLGITNSAGHYRISCSTNGYNYLDYRYGRSSFSRYMGTGWKEANEQETTEVKNFVKEFFDSAINTW